VFVDDGAASDQRERDGSVPVFVDDGAASDQRERDGSVPVFAQALRDTLDPAAIGLAFQPVCEEAERAVDQAMDFGALFIGMSMFLIASALALLTLLYAHGLQTRTGEMGALLAVGWPPRRVGAWLLFESLPIILAGIFVGTLCGVGYARMLLYGLVKFWPDAVAGTPLRFHVTLPTLALGAAIATMCVLAVLLTCVTRACRRPARELLQRDFASTATLSRGRRLPGALFGAVMLLATLLSVYQAFYGAADNPTIWFFASGAAALATALTAYALLLGWWTRRRAPAHPTLWRLILMQLARRRSRSLGVAVVTGCGVFMIISVTAMQAAMNFDVERPESGAGGFSVFASTTTPVRSSEETLLGLPRDSGVPLRVWDGDDAGCLNLNRAIRPRIYAVEPQALIARNAFAPPDEVKALWALLNLSLDDGVVPALVGDSDTAMWGLQAAADPERGAEFAYPGDTGETFRVRAVGKLPMRLSLFQGAMLISEENFTRMFPHEAGYRAFLIRADDAQATAAQLNRDHGRLGMEAIPSEERLRAFYAVERAYLAMFLVLGGIGMMLGAGGASVVALRNLAERRAEFALLLAVGYEPHLVRRMALIENAFLVTTGILFGVAAAALAITPLMLQAQHAAGLPALVAMLLGVITAYLAAVLITTRVALAEIPLAALRTE
ncbi:MAG TPA: ABC transporter permease, partial [Candidatus Hydrogenedentes bacterium]|nr:ABC transporter permease [Candidatus Hydrogenedentota bacterium]